MLTFVIICCLLVQLKALEVDFKSDFRTRAAFLQQFGYLGTSDTVPVGINILPEHAAARSLSSDDELAGMNEIPVEVVKKLQLYAGVEQSGVFDDETIGMMVTPRCQNPDIIDESNSLTRFFLGQEVSRRKRNAGWSTPKWKKLDLTFALENTTPQNDQAKLVISAAFAAWAECSTLSFRLVDITQSPDIEVKFASWRHDPPKDCSFDGPGGVKAHAFYPPLGKAHFDEDEDWSNDCELYSVALHEIGHLLGLGHSFHKTSIMFAYFNSEFVKERCEGGNSRPLSSHDIDNIRSLYGSESCNKAEDPPVVTASISEGPGGIDEFTTTPTSATSATTAADENEITTSATPTQKQTTNTFSGSVLATFATDGPNNWQLECGEIIENILSSPYYPEIYPNGMNCTWTISIPPGMRAVTMHFIKFELEDGGEECAFDYLQIIEQDGTSHKLCGLQTQSLTFESKVLNINFISDSLKQAAGFKILLIYEAEPPKPPCRAVLEDSEGLVTQDHPDLDDHEECVYVINSTDPNKQILIIVDHIGDHCSRYELLESEEDGEESLIGSCSEDGTGVTFFTSTTFFIKFRPQESGSFSVKYYTISAEGYQGCSVEGTRDYNRQFLESGIWQPFTDTADLYYPNTDCILYIPRNDQGKELIVEIENMNIEYDKNCKYDFVEVFTAENGTAQRYCGQGALEFRTLGDTLVYFHSDGSVEESGLVLKYKVYECEHQLNSSQYLTMNGISLEGDCSYNYDVPRKSFACFDFSSPVDGNGRCEGNVEVLDARNRDETGVKYCDNFSTILDGGEVIKASQSKDGAENHGLGYVEIDDGRDCYKKISVTSSRDRSFSFKTAPRGKQCIVHLVAQPGYRLVLSPYQVNLRRTCQSREHIRIFQSNRGCGGEIKVCQSMRNIVINSNEAFVVFSLIDRKSKFSLKARQEYGAAKSSVCLGTCDVNITEGPTVSAYTVSTSTPEDVGNHDNNGKSAFYFFGIKIQCTRYCSSK